MKKYTLFLLAAFSGSMQGQSYIPIESPFKDSFFRSLSESSVDQNGLKSIALNTLFRDI